MTQVHAVGHLTVVFAAIAYVALGLAMAVLEKVPRQAHLVSLSLVAAIVLTGLAGALTAVIGSGPREGIHWLYGVAVALGVLAGIGFGTTMAPRPRGLVTMAMGTLILLLAFRLASTG
jgi:hypothetical protein